MRIFYINFFLVLTLSSCRGEYPSSSSNLGKEKIELKTQPIGQEDIENISKIESVSNITKIKEPKAEVIPNENPEAISNSKAKAPTLNDDEKPYVINSEHMANQDNPPIKTPLSEKSEERKIIDIKTQESQNIEVDKELDKEEQQQVSHAIWDALLKKCVDVNGGVDYSGLKKEHNTLKGYLSLLSSNAPQPSWTKAQSMSYWINAYNAHTVDLILQNYPIGSITDLDKGNPWEVKRIKIGGQVYSLNNIEHDILRKNYKDPRIHFAVNCAAKSCPKLHNEAWTEMNLEKNLEALTKSFVNNTTSNKITAGNLVLSKIFEWYMIDFGNLISFLNKYSNSKINESAKINFMDYDWQLNKQ